MLDLLHVPLFPRAADYAGVWAIEPMAGAVLWRAAHQLDLVSHVREAMDDDGRPKLRAAQAEYETVKAPAGAVAVVRLQGSLMKANSSMSDGTSTVMARRAIRKAAADPDVCAIMLAIDSPGGTVSGTADLAADVLAAQKSKPVWAYADDLCASAAYWIASQASAIFANTNTALVGSIGTLAVVYDLSGAAEKEGVKALVFGTGPLKGAGTPGAPVTEAQQEYFRALVEDSQRSFDAAVARGRGLTPKQLEGAKTGGVFSAPEALDRKLIDGIRSFEAVVTDLAAEGKRHARKQRSAHMPHPIEEAAAESLAPTAPHAATAVAAPAVVTLPDPTASMREAAAAEMERIAGIQAVCAEHGQPAIAATAIRERWSVEKAELASMKAALPNSVQALNPAIVSRSHSKDCTLQALQAAMILRVGGRLDHPAYRSQQAVAIGLPGWLRVGLNEDARQRAMEWGHRYSTLSAMDICREAVRLNGQDVPHQRDDLLRAAFSTGGALTDIFTTNVNARLIVSYMEETDTTQGWTTEMDVQDFRTNDRIRIEAGPGLKKHPRGSTADHATYSDKIESYKIARYSKQFEIDEQDIIDQNFTVFEDTPVRFGAAAARLRPDLVYSIILANPALPSSPGNALFASTTGQANIKTSSALAAATLKIAAAFQRLIQDANNVNLNLQPSHLIVPPTLEFLGYELIRSASNLIARGGTTDTTVERGDINSLQRLGLDLVSEARLENGVINPDDNSSQSGSSSTWYLCTDQAHTIEVGYLAGTGRAPQVRTYVLHSGKWGINWDVKMDIGAKALDWRGFVKNTA